MTRDDYVAAVIVSVRASLILIQTLLLVALAAVGGAAAFAIDKANRFAQQLALVSRAQQYHQQTDTMQEALRADVNAALLVALDDPDAAEVVLARVRENARRFSTALDSLAKLQLAADLQRSIADTRTISEAYIARATAITAIAVRNHERARALEPKFIEAFDVLRRANDDASTRLARATELAEKQAQQAARVTQGWILAAVVGIALFAGLLLAGIGRSMRMSLRRVRDAARALASGNLAVRSEMTSKDEVGEISGAINKMADDLQSLIDKLRAEAERDAFGTQLVQALEMSDTEEEVHVVVARAMAQIGADIPMEILLSDSSSAHLERAAQHPTAGAPGCSVESPFSCVAVRRGNPVVFEDSDALNSCPRLRDRASGSLSAVCVPVSFMGRSLGVLHATAPVRKIPASEQIAQLTTLGIQAGARIGTVRAFERTQLQARTDGLTGLNNRRTLEEEARGHLATGTPYAFVLADLDNFKRLNDSHGHEAGDKALRLFSDVLKKSVRQGDLAARWGGEEFAIFLPGATANRAFEIVERLRADLAQALLASGGTPFTSSFGIADSSMGAQLEEIVRTADEALYRSKEAGRDRASIGNASGAGVHRRTQDQRAVIDIKRLANET